MSRYTMESSRPVTSRSATTSTPTKLSFFSDEEAPDEIVVDKLIALLLWLKTFPDLENEIVVLSNMMEGDDETDTVAAASTILKTLGTLSASRAIAKVATGILLSGKSSEEKQIDAANKLAKARSSDQIWSQLFLLFKKDSDKGNGCRSQQKLRILSNLLHFAVTETNLEQRKGYVEKMTSLPKKFQKKLKEVIVEESNRKNDSSRKSNNDSSRKSSRKRSAGKSRHHPCRNGSGAQSTPARQPSNTGPHSAGSPNIRTSTGKFSRKAISSTASRKQQQHKRSPSPATSWKNLPRSPCHRYGSTTLFPPSPLASPRKQVNSSSTPTHKTPEFSPNNSRLEHGSRSSNQCDEHFQQRSKNKKAFEPYVDGESPMPDRGGLLSPGFLESPNKVQSLVRELRDKNDQLRQIVVEKKKNEEATLQRLQEQRVQHRKEMVKLEREERLKQENLCQQLEEQIKSLDKELTNAKQKSSAGQAAEEELQRTRDEVDLLQHHKVALAETTEKLRVYKEKVAELQDAKETLQREQDAHGNAVDHIVELENQVKQLLPVKRQLEDYKVRAVEAEVKLVESQDCLRRLEEEISEQGSVNTHLLNDVVLQKEQMQELQVRIREDTEKAMASAGEGVIGIGEGLSELNPTVREELIRLRNENLQLRAFAAAREQDAVQNLTERLEDSQRMADRWKKGELATKHMLSETKQDLNATQERETALVEQLEDSRTFSDQQAKQIESLNDQLAHNRDLLATTRESLESSEDRNKVLDMEVQEWTVKNRTVEKMAAERGESLKKTQSELQSNQDALATAERKIVDLEASVKNWELRTNEITEEQKVTASTLEKTEATVTQVSMELKASQETVANLQTSVENLNVANNSLKQDLEDERKSKQNAMEEAEKTLKVTREELKDEHEAILKEQYDDFQQQLETKQTEYEMLKEESENQLAELKNEWSGKYNKLQVGNEIIIEKIRQETKEQIETNAQEHRSNMEALEKETKKQIDTKVLEHDSKVEALKAEAMQDRSNLITKGKGMLRDAKSKRDDKISALENDISSLESNLRDTKAEKQKLEDFAKKRITSLKRSLEVSNAQAEEITNENEDLQTKIKSLELEKFNLQEDNDGYRRQLGGRYGADGKQQSQLEKIQKEYNEILEENRNLKKRVQQYGDDGSPNSMGSEVGAMISYQRGGGASRSTISQLRQEYDEQLENLNDEKRELIMRHSAACTDVQKAEQRAWQKEQTIAKLEQEVTNLKLCLQRAELSYENGDDVLDLQEEGNTERGENYTTTTLLEVPGIDRGMMESTKIENPEKNQTSASSVNFEVKGHLMTNDTVKLTEPPNENDVLSPTQKHNFEANRSPQREKITPGKRARVSETATPKTLMEHTQFLDHDENRKGEEVRPECKQS